MKNGAQFGFLTVIEYAEKRGHNHYWLCKCTCGKEVACQAYNLMSGNSSSCGCQKGALGSKNRARHGACRGINHGGRTKEYMAWKTARQRCRNPKNPKYKDYGARGIQMCERWDNFANFIADMSPRPNGKTLDRRNNDGHYEPGNCRWATPVQQSSNQRRTVLYPWKGEELSLGTIASNEGVQSGALWSRVIKRKDSVADAVAHLKKLPL